MNEKIIGKYRIVTEDSPLIIARVYNLKAKKEYNALIHNYRFRSLEHRDEWIAGILIAQADRDRIIQERKDARKNFVNPAKVGDILEASGGYDQTNVDYYQVTGLIGKKMVEIREIGARSVEGSTYAHGMADEVKPAKDSFKKDSEPLRRVVKGSSYKDYCVTINEVANAYRIDENEKTYRSWYA